MDNGLVRLYNKQHSTNNRVLILIVVDNGLVQGCKKDDESDIESLNPYCSGQWSRTNQIKAIEPCDLSLNPYCSGQWSRTRPYKTLLIINKLKNFTKQISTFLN